MKLILSYFDFSTIRDCCEYIEKNPMCENIIDFKHRWIRLHEIRLSLDSPED